MSTPEKCRSITEWLEMMPNFNDLRWQLEKADAIRKWCLRDVKFKEGDRVKIVREINGWAGYGGTLSIGATGVVVEIDFNPFSRNGVGAWHADVILDREWFEHYGKKYWHGPVAEMPKAMISAGNESKHTFSLLVEWLEPE